MHENAHNMGAVQDTAPYATGVGHCNDGQDIMCYPDGGPTSSYRIRPGCEDYVRYDCYKDSYFDTNTEPGDWLRTHWNIGWSGNNFLAF